MTDSSVHFQKIEAYPFGMIECPSLRNDGALFGMTTLAPHFGIGGIYLLSSRKCLCFFLSFVKKIIPKFYHFGE